MRRQLRVDDVTMICQWIVTFMLAAFLLLPLFQPSDTGIRMRITVVSAFFLVSCIMTAIYLLQRSRSERSAGSVVVLTALLDVAVILASLLAWPDYLPDLFWVLAVVVIMTAARTGYRWTAGIALGVSALYAITQVAGFGGAVPTRTIVAGTLIRVAFLLLVATAVAWFTERVKRERLEMAVLSSVAAAGATMEAGVVLRAVVEAISQATGGSRATVFLAGPDQGAAPALETSESDPASREKILAVSLDLVSGIAAELDDEWHVPVTIAKRSQSQLADLEWPDGVRTGPVLTLPFMVRKEVKGIVVVELPGPRRHFLEREVDISAAILAQAAADLENSLVYAEEQSKREESEALYHTLRELGSTLDVGEVAETACRMAMAATGSRGCTAFLLDERKGLLVPRMAVESGGFRWGEFTAGNEVSAQAVADEISRRGRPRVLTIDEPAGSPILPPFLRLEAAVTMVPFYYRGTLAGALCLSESAPGRLSGEQESRLGVVAGETALAIMNARLHERISLDAAQLASLMQLTNAIGSTANLTTIMGVALDTVRHLFDATSGLIYRVDQESQTLRHVDSFGYPAEVIERLDTPPFYPAGECRTVAEERPVSVLDLSAGEPPCRVLEKIRKGSTVCVCMKSEGSNIGVLHIRSDRPGAFKEEDIRLIVAIADQVALALQRALLFEEISRLAVTDPLTGVFNVRRLESVLSDEISRARRYSRPVSFLMIDVDNLKGFNDMLGHQRGDAVLSTVAGILDSNTRKVDKVFRYGGDEFCIVLPETDHPEAMVVAEKVRRAVSEHRFSDDFDEGITISLGVASYPGDAEEPEELIKRADSALYTAKQRGRNSVATGR